MLRRLPSVLTLMVLAMTARAPAGEISFPTPSHDRWHYPFNFTPGTRTAGSCFGATGDAGFNDRDGVIIAVWSTVSSVAPGQGADAYGIRSVRVTLTNLKDAAWGIDTTPDEWFTYDVNGDETVNHDGIPRGEPGDTDGESSDADAGRPIELFGVGFGPTYTLQSWVESSLYLGSDSVNELPRDPFPFVYADDGPDLLHVEDSVKGLHNGALGVFSFTPQPWATGAPVNYTPGNQPVPFDVVFDVDLSLSDGRVRRYFQKQLDVGRVAVAVTSLSEAVIMGPTSGLPIFYLKEGMPLDPGAKAPRLDIYVCQSMAPDLDLDCDVDSDDVEAFIACLTGPAMGPPASGCERADFDTDFDVDQADFGVLQRCFCGPGEEPPPACGS